jgi:pimeloyl-ACP methyl ester carboxylesterase
VSELPLAQRLLALFTSPACAEAIAGDFAEARGEHGAAWFWWQVLTTAAALGRSAMAAAPLGSAGVAALGCLQFGSLMFAGVAPVAIFTALLGTPVSWIWLAVAWWSGAFVTGFTLVSLSPARGAAVSVLLAVLGEAVLLLLRLTVLPGNVLLIPNLVFWPIAAFTAVPLLAGASIARRRIIAPVLACLLLAFAAPASSQTAEWRDESSHTARLVEVEEGVRLEVLDWGGQGRALVLLTGLGDSAHVFDDIAPALAARYRVVGVSRRGHPGSSSPVSGYTTARLAADIVRVMDVVGLPRPIVVGHSFAGEEMHVLGARHASRIGGLIYVDAAFDRADRFAEHEAANRGLPPPPRPGPADLASFGAVRAYLTRTQGSPGPEARLRARYVANPDGSIRGPWSPDAHVMQAYSAEMKAMTTAYEPERIQVPALAIYAVPVSASDLMRPWFKADDAALRERVETLFPLERENVARHARWFTAFAARGRVAELAGGHDLVVANPREVRQQIDAFVSSLP